MPTHKEIEMKKLLVWATGLMFASGPIQIIAALYLLIWAEDDTLVLAVSGVFTSIWAGLLFVIALGIAGYVPAKEEVDDE